MSDPAKSFLDLARGTLAGLGPTNVFERAVEAQRSNERLATSGLLGDEKLGRLALGLSAGETARAMDLAAGRISAFDQLQRHALRISEAQRSALKIQDAFERHTAMRSAVDEAMGKINRFEASAFTRALDTATRLSQAREHQFGGLIDKSVTISMQHLADPYLSFNVSHHAAMVGISRDASSALARTQHWANALLGSPERNYAELLGIGNRYGQDFEALHRAASSISGAIAELDGSSFVARAAALGGRADMTATATKMSLFTASLARLIHRRSGLEVASVA